MALLADQDVAVAVDHLVRVLAVGGPDPGPLDHQHLGLDVEGGVALGRPRDLEGQGDDRRPQQHDQEGARAGRPSTAGR